MQYDFIHLPYFFDLFYWVKSLRCVNYKHQRVFMTVCVCVHERGKCVYECVCVCEHERGTCVYECVCVCVELSVIITGKRKPVIYGHFAKHIYICYWSIFLFELLCKFGRLPNRLLNQSKDT